MQKFLRTLLLAAMMIVPWATQAQSTLTVADGTTTNSYVPVYGLYVDAYNNAQFIYPATDLAAMSGNEISSMTFYSGSADKTWSGNNFQVYLTETTDASISAFTGADAMTLVYDGPVSITSGQMVITFDESYTYGGGNLQVAFIQNAKGSYSSCSWYGVTATGSSVHGYNSSNVSSASPTQRNFLPKVTFSYEPALACGAVRSLAADVSMGVISVSWEAPRTGAASYELNYKVAGAEGDGTTVNTTNTNFLLTGLDAGTEYVVSVRANCGTDGYGKWRSVNATTKALMCLAGGPRGILDDHTGTNQYLPYYAFYNYSLSEQIYTAAEVGAAASLTTLSYEVTATTPSRNVNIYIGSTTLSSFSSINDAVALDDLTLVYTGELDGTLGWHTVTLTTPFDYDGNSNIVVVMHRPHTQYASSGNFGVISTSVSQALYGYSDSDEMTPSSLSSGSNGVLSVKNNLVFNMDAPCTQTAACAAAANLTVDAVSASSVSVSWLPGYHESAWDVAYRAADASEWTTVATGISDLSYTFTGLEGNTDYEFRVQFTCSDSYDYASVVEAHTYCSIETLPFTEDFENIEYNGAWPECWIRILNYNTDPSANYEFNHTEEGTNSMYLSASNSYNMFASPAIPTEGNNILVNFWAKMPNSTYGSPVLQAGVMTDPADPETFQPVVTITSAAGSGWNEYTFATTGLDAEATYYVAWKFYGYSTYGTTYAAAIDDITIDVVPQYEVTFNITNQEGDADNTSWGTASASTLTPKWGTDVTFTTEPAQYRRTAAWYLGEDLENAVATDVDEFVIEHVTSDTTVTVLFGYGQFQVTAQPNYENMGSVSTNSQYDNDMFDYNTEAVLTATANYGFDFLEWLDEDGNSFSEENPLTLTALQNYNLTARFFLHSFVLTDASENGYIDGISHDGLTDSAYTYGSLVSLTATPNEHYHFAGWSDGYEGETRTYRVTKDSTFAALFEADVYQIAISDPYTPNAATYTVNGEEYEGPVSFDYLDEVTVAATDIDVEHYTFLGWTAQVYENDMWVTETLSTDPVYTFTAEADIELIPAYTAQQFTLTIAPNDDNMGSVRFADEAYADMTSVTVDYNTPVEVVATAVAGSYSGFDSWQLDGEVVSTAANYTVTVSENIDLVAYFAYGTVSFDYSILPAQAAEDGATVVGSVNGETVETPAFADNFTVTASGTDHWLFDHWTDGYGNDLGTDASYTETVFEGVNYIAWFVRDEHTILAQTGSDALGDDYGTVTVTNEDGDEASLFTHDDYATVEFVPGYGYTFAGWEDEDGNLLSTDNPYTFMVEDDVTLTATVNPIPYDVFVDIYNDGDGSYPRGDVSIVSPVNYLDEAEPQYIENVYGYVFDFWADDNGEEVTDFTVYEPTTYWAHFKKDLFNVNGALDAQYAMMGHIETNTEAEYLEEVTLTAVNNFGYTFTGWVDAEGNTLAVDGVNIIDITDNTITIVAGGLDPTTPWEDNTFTVYAAFDYNFYTITAFAEPDDAGTIEGAGVYPYSMSRTLTAIPAEHYHLLSWSTGDTDNPLPYIVEGDMEFIAYFVLDKHEVTVNMDEAEKIKEVTGTGTYTYGDHAEVSLAAAHGYTFVQWEDGITDNPRALVVDGDIELVPVFSTNSYTVTVNVNKDAWGTATGGATDEYLSVLSLSATPNPGYVFVCWKNEDGEILSTEAEFDYTITDDATVTAYFTYDQYTVNIAADGEEMGTVEFYDVVGGGSSFETLTVADGTTTNGFVPVYGYYVDAYNNAQFIYPATDLAAMSGNEISSMTFYSGSADKTWSGNNFQVYLTETTDASISAFTGADAMTLVYDGPVSITSGQMVITFDESYTYGGGNLQVAFIQNAKGSYSSCSWYGVTATGSSVHGYNSSNVTAASATQRNFLPKVTFSYFDPEAVEPMATYNGTTATVDNGATIGVQAVANPGYHFVDFNGDNPGIPVPITAPTIEGTCNITLKLTDSYGDGWNGGSLVLSQNGTTLGTYTISSGSYEEYTVEVSAAYPVDWTYTTGNWAYENSFVIEDAIGNQVAIHSGSNLGRTDSFTGACYDVTYAYNYEVVVDQDMDITANFEPNTYTVSTDANGIARMGDENYYVRGTVTPSFDAPFASEQTIEATAEYGYEFVNWVDFEGNVVSEANPYTFTVAGNHYFKAIFDYEKFDLNVTGVNGTVTALINNTDQLDAAESISYNDYYGTVVALLATSVSAANYTWQGWYDENDELVSTDNPYTFSLFGDVTLTAKYEPNIYSVTIAANGDGSVSGDGSGDYAYGTELNVVATADAHNHFVNWTNGTEVLSTEAEATITVSGDMDILANFEENAYTVVANVNDVLYGTADFDVASPVAPLTDVTFTATPNHGYRFVNWTDAEGAEVAATASFTVTIEADYEVTANFEVDDFTLTVVSNDTIMGLASADIEEGDVIATEVTAEGINVTAQYMTSVSLNANAKEGYHFVNWTVDDTEISNVESLDVIVDDNKTIVANFYYNNYTVTATSSDVTRGTVTGGTESGVQEYYYGNIATLTATPLEGYSFKQWIDGEGNVYTDASIEVLVNGDKTFTAYFIIAGEFTVDVVYDAVQGTVTGMGGYQEGDDATLTATANNGYSFVNWTDADDVVLGTDATLVIANITADTTVYANFGPNDYTVTVTAENGSVEGAGTYAYNSVATLTATADEHYHFVMWSDNVISNPRNITVTGDIELEAVFAIDEFAVNATATNGTVEGTGTYAYGEEVTLTATANAIAACYSFDGWYNGNTQVSTSAEYTFTVTEDVNLNAVFSALTFSGSETAAICAGSTYTWNGYNCVNAGVYTFTTTTADGCDSTATLTLTVNQPQDAAPVMASACGSYTWTTNGQTYTESGTYTTSITDANGCTANATLYLNVMQPANTTETVVACDSYTWNGYNCITSGEYTYNFTDVNGCDAVATLNLTINNSTTSSLTEVACESYTWDATDGSNTVYTESGVYTFTTVNADGCNHVATLNLTINDPVFSEETVTTTSNPYVWNGMSLTESGSYTYTTTAANGCDSTVTLYLTINTMVITTYTVTLDVNDATMGNVNNGATIAEGSIFAAVATANDGYYFVEWTDANGNSVSTDNPYTFIVTGDIALTAVFAANPVATYTVTLVSENTAWGTVSAGATVDEGNDFTATATAAEGYHFVAWVNNGIAVSTANPYTFTVTSDVTLTARFEADPKPVYTVTVIYDETMGSVTGAGEYVEGTLVTLTATPKTGYRFVQWSTGDTENFINFTITADMTITATFELVGIDDVDMENVTIYTADSRIFVKGAEGKQVVLYDVNGRAISREANAAETVEFRVSAAGVYLVKVGDAPACRVAVVR